MDVQSEMCYERNQQGEILFTVDEFLTTQQVQSYFLRTVSKLQQSRLNDQESEQDEDVMVAEEELHSGVR